MGFTTILSFLSDNWKAIVIGLLVAGAIFYVQALRVDIAHKETEIVGLKHDVEVLTTNNATLTTALDTQNGAIGKISDLATATQKGFQQLGVNINQQSVALDARLQSILKDKKPITCDDTIKYLIEARKGFKQ